MILSNYLKSDDLITNYLSDYPSGYTLSFYLFPPAGRRPGALLRRQSPGSLLSAGGPGCARCARCLCWSWGNVMSEKWLVYNG